MRLSVDTSVLFYLFDTDAGERHELALALMDRLPRADVVMAAQTFGELFNATRIKRSAAVFRDAQSAARRWSGLFPVEATTAEDMLAGALLADRYRIQLWDAVILSVARRAGPSVLLAEDMQDGATIDGVLILNPFEPGNRARLDALLPFRPAPGTA